MRKYLLNLLGLVVLVGANAYLQANSNTENAEEDIYQSGKIYIASEQQMSDIDKTLALAKKNTKLALIIMGANWCHDSRSLASNLYLPEVKSIIDKNYELLFVDVGYLTKIEKVITRFGMPVIYATPTVLIIDPETESRINGHNMHIWRDADSISVADTVDYFSDIAKNRKSLLEPLSISNVEELARLKKLNQSIDEFEKKQANRIYKAFSVVGPLLKERNNGGEPKDFYKHWKSVSKMRYKITDDLSQLCKQAIELSQNVKSGENLIFPEYPAFEWE